MPLFWLALNVAWFRSHFTQTLFADARIGRLVEIHIKENGAVFCVIHGWPTGDGCSLRSAPIGAPGFGIPVMFNGNTLQFRDLLFGISTMRGTATAGMPAVAVTGSVAVVPWLVLQAFATLLCVPACLLLVQRIRHQKRKTQGQCLTCGYDLRATPERCPECGATHHVSRGQI